MNKLILYAIIIFIIYKLTHSYKENFNRNVSVEDLVNTYKDYSSETDPENKKKKDAILTEKYYALLKEQPDIFKNGIPDNIMNMI